MFRMKMVTTIIKSKAFILAVTIVFVVSTAILAYFLSVRDFSLFPNKNFQHIVYTDNPIGGNSQINNYVVSDSSINIGFKLNEAIKSPYAGVSVALKDGKTFNLAHYNQVTIKVRGHGIEHLSLALFEPNSISKNDKRDKDIVFYTSFAISSEKCNYTIPMSQLEVPYWWFELNNIKNDKELKPALRSVICLNISNAYTPKIDENKSFEVYDITFTRDNKPLIMWILLIDLIFLVFSFVSILLFEKLRTTKSSVTINYKPVETHGEIASNADVVNYINNNFHNSELSLEMVSAETGVSQRRITNHIQSLFACNFKTYLNRLRINESKRLLIETGLNIGEIAFKVGFNNQSHFNRVF